MITLQMMKNPSSEVLWFRVRVEVEGLDRRVAIGCWSESGEEEVEGFKVCCVPD